MECLKRPDLKEIPMAVCGSADNRRGIILAKNDIAKTFGIKTAETLWQAKQKCPQLITVRPHHDQYRQYSLKVRAIYERFTDLVEAFGIDECWLDITGSTRLFGSPQEIARKIQLAVKEELGLNISIGISFNKIFAKMGSDLKKPAAITEISRENYKEKLWSLPIGDMFGVGKASVKKMNQLGIQTIGDFALLSEKEAKIHFGKHGIELWLNVNGLNRAKVTHSQYQEEVKSIGHGVTCSRDLTTEEQVNSLFFLLAEDVSKRLRKKKLLATTVQIGVKDNTLLVKEYQKPLPFPTRSASSLAQLANEIFSQKHLWRNDIRALTIRATGLLEENSYLQTNLLVDIKKLDDLEHLENNVDNLRSKYGNTIVTRASGLKQDYIEKTVVDNEQLNSFGKFFNSKE